jgi:hypothetical protein
MAMIGVGYSHSKNPVKAAHEAAAAALSQIQGQKCHSCLVFSTVGYSQSVLLGEIKKDVGAVPMVGCSGAGIIAPGIADESLHCLAVLVIADPRIRLDTAGYPDLIDSGEAGRTIGENLSRRISDDARCVLLFPCGLNVIVDDLVPEMEMHLGRKLPILGGLAADNLIRDKTYQYHDWKIYEGGVSAAIISGDFDLFTDVSHGCAPIGLEMEVTKAEGNRLYEIDNRPVMDVLAEFVGEGIISDFGKVILHFCIGQLADPDIAESYDQYVIRYIAKYYPEDKSISLPVKIKKGEKLWITRRDRDKMFSACQRSILKLKNDLKDKSPFLVLDFNCVGRGKIVLADEEKKTLLESFQGSLAPGSPWIGFLSYGEFCPVRQKNTFHNYTNAFALFVWR